METWQGRYLDGKSAVARKARVLLLPHGLRIVLGAGKVLVWPYAGVRQSQGKYRGEPVRLERGPDFSEALLVDDTGFLTGLRRAARALAGRFHDPASRPRRAWLTLAAALFSLAVAWTAYRWGVPTLAAWATPRVPIAWEKGLGQSALKILAPPESRCSSPGLDKALKRVVARLKAAQPDNSYEFSVVVADSGMVNAFALPGGWIVVCRGLLEKTRTPEELAGVLAHEMQHVIKRHATRMIIQDSSIGLILSALSGDATAGMAWGLHSAQALANLQYSRGVEEEADDGGMRMLIQAGIAPSGMLDFFKKMKEDGGEPQMLKYISDHPSLDDRLKKLSSLAKSSSPPGFKPSALLPGFDWPALVTSLPCGKKKN